MTEKQEGNYVFWGEKYSILIASKDRNQKQRAFKTHHSDRFYNQSLTRTTLVCVFFFLLPLQQREQHQ